MFGPYQIEYEGRSYFHNVPLREFHLFDYDGNSYLLDVERMATSLVLPRVAALIRRLAWDSGSLVPESAITELRRLKLIAGEEEAPVEAAPADKQGQSGKKAEFAVVNIALFLVQECNMRCVYCYGDGGEYAAKGVMSEETAFAAVDWLMENSKNVEKVNISFFGGEPLLNYLLMKKVVFQAKEKAAEKGKQAAFSITTNGSLLTNEIIAFLHEEKIDPLISFDGPPEYQDRLRPFKDGSGSHATVRANVQKLRTVFPHLTARATICGDTDPFRSKEGMEQAGFTTCILSKASPVLLKTTPDGASPDGLGEQMLERMLAFHRREVDQLLIAIRERKINKECFPALLPTMAAMYSGQKRIYGCGIGKGMAGISVTGDIYPCHRFVGQADMRLGNIAGYHIDGSNDYHRATVKRLPECRYCWARYYCGGGCFYHNKAHTGDMHRPEPRDCKERKAMFEGLIHVYCRLDDGDKEYLQEILKEIEPERHP